MDWAPISVSNASARETMARATETCSTPVTGFSPKMLPFPKNTALPLIEAYQRTCLAHLPPGTVAVYISILRQFAQWVMERTSSREEFQSNALTPSVVERYLF